MFKLACRDPMMYNRRQHGGVVRQECSAFPTQQIITEARYRSGATRARLVSALVGEPA